MRRFYWAALVLLLVSSSFAEGKAPDFTLTKLDGGKFRLSEQISKGPVILHFWDTCCPVCRLALPYIEKLHQAYGDSLTILAISTDSPKSLSKLRPLIKSNGYTFDAASDADMEIRKLFGGTESPLTLLIARDGRVVLRFVGSSIEDEQKLSDCAHEQLHSTASLSTTNTPGDVK